MQTINTTAYTEDDSQIEAIKAAMKALKIKFEISTEKTNYDPEFVEKIVKSKKEIAEGKVTRVKKDDLQNFLGL